MGGTFHTFGGGTNARAVQKGKLMGTVKIQTEQTLRSRGFYPENPPCGAERYVPRHSVFGYFVTEKLSCQSRN